MNGEDIALNLKLPRYFDRFLKLTKIRVEAITRYASGQAESPRARRLVQVEQVEMLIEYKRLLLSITHERIPRVRKRVVAIENSRRIKEANRGFAAACQVM